MRTSATPQAQRVPDPNRYLHRGPFLVDLQSNRLFVKGQQVDLPFHAFRCFVALARSSPHPVGFSDLVEESLGVSLANVDAHDYARWRIEKLRKVIEPDPEQPHYIVSVPGCGYRLDYGRYY